ncbi:hypothetical protein Efla_006022 [Eimeria flavescens]
MGGWPLARAQPLAPVAIHFARLAPRAPTSLAAAASTLTPSATAAHARALVTEPPCSAASTSPAYTMVPGGFLRTLHSPNSCLTTAKLTYHSSCLTHSATALTTARNHYPRPTLLLARLDKGATPPISAPPRRLSQAMCAVVRAAVPNLDAQGISEPSTACWSTPIVMVEIEEQDRPKTNFISPDCQRQCKRLRFGFAPSPAIFQRMVDMLLGGVKWVFAVGYTDDVIVDSDSCCFGTASVKYLGHIVSRDGIHACPSKIQAVVDVPVPASAKAVQRFFEKCRSHRKFTPNFSTVAAPLFQDTTVKHGFKWSEACDLAWRRPREAHSSETVLVCAGLRARVLRGRPFSLGVQSKPKVSMPPTRALDFAPTGVPLDLVHRPGSQPINFDCLSRAPLPPLRGQKLLILDEFPDRGVLAFTIPTGRRPRRPPGPGPRPRAGDVFLSDDDEPADPAPSRVESEIATPSLDPAPPIAVASISSRQVALPHPVQHDDTRAAQQSDPPALASGHGSARAVARLVAHRSACLFQCTSSSIFCMALTDSQRTPRWLNLPIGAPFELVATDLYGPLTIAHAGNTHIVVFIDYHTRGLGLSSCASFGYPLQPFLFVHRPGTFVAYLSSLERARARSLGGAVAARPLVLPALPPTRTPANSGAASPRGLNRDSPSPTSPCAFPLAAPAGPVPTAAPSRPLPPSQPASLARPAQLAQPAQSPPIPKQAALPSPTARAIQGVTPGQFQMADLKRVAAVKAVLGTATAHEIFVHKELVYIHRRLKAHRALRGEMRGLLIPEVRLPAVCNASPKQLRDLSRCELDEFPSLEVLRVLWQTPFERLERL